jgi:prevent-host-death family protein
LFNPQRENAHGVGSGDDAALRSVSGTAPWSIKIEFSIEGRLTPSRLLSYDGHMKKAGIAALKNNLSRYLDQVSSGESILVMDRNRPVAQIVPLPSNGRGLVADEDRLARLERKGLIRRGSTGSLKWLAKRRPVKLKGSVLRDLLDERGSGW